jgi:hypothetical protein
MNGNTKVEWAWGYAVFELDTHAIADSIYVLAARADELPLPPSSPHAISFEGRCGGARIGAAGYTIMSLVVAAARRWA